MMIQSSAAIMGLGAGKLQAEISSGKEKDPAFHGIPGELQGRFHSHPLPATSCPLPFLSLPCLPPPLCPFEYTP